jgi:uncharacterized OB-fold protein
MPRFFLLMTNNLNSIDFYEETMPIYVIRNRGQKVEINPMQDPNSPIKLGWKCPTCQSVYSPEVKECPKCSPPKTESVNTPKQQLLLE